MKTKYLPVYHYSDIVTTHVNGRIIYGCIIHPNELPQSYCSDNRESRLYHFHDYIFVTPILLHIYNMYIYIYIYNIYIYIYIYILCVFNKNKNNKRITRRTGRFFQKHQFYHNITFLYFLYFIQTFI